MRQCLYFETLTQIHNTRRIYHSFWRFRCIDPDPRGQKAREFGFIFFWPVRAELFDQPGRPAVPPSPDNSRQTPSVHSQACQCYTSTQILKFPSGFLIGIERYILFTTAENDDFSTHVNCKFSWSCKLKYVTFKIFFMSIILDVSDWKMP